jgi:GNAT superfamily N-acetyltransferase
MIRLAEEFFVTKNDPSQISVTEEVMERLRQIHHATLSERGDGNGPIAWVIVIPITQDLMRRFIAGRINERELLEKIPFGAVYDVVYLCSALVLPEHRGKGLAKQLMCTAVKTIQENHPITSLLYWSFSGEGTRLAESVARSLKLPLHKKRG